MADALDSDYMPAAEENYEVRRLRVFSACVNSLCLPLSRT
jgi:hypothetical protein